MTTFDILTSAVVIDIRLHVTHEEKRERKAEERKHGKGERERVEGGKEMHTNGRRKRGRATAGLTRVPSLVGPCLV